MRSTGQGVPQPLADHLEGGGRGGGMEARRAHVADQPLEERFAEVGAPAGQVDGAVDHGGRVGGDDLFAQDRPCHGRGVRTAAVEVVASATLAAFIAAGGLGRFVYTGYTLNRPEVMLVGAVPVALLAIASEVILGAAQRAISVPEA